MAHGGGLIAAVALVLHPLCLAAEDGIPAGVTAFPSPTARGEWVIDRGDLAQTGRCPLPGRIRRPAVQWSLPVGPQAARLAVRPAAGEARLELVADPPKPSEGDAFAPEPAPRLDLAGDGKLVSIRPTHNLVYGRFLPDAAGWQKFVMEDGMSVKNRPDGPRRPVATGSLFRYDHGREERVWTTGPEEQCEIPLCAVADMDGDGTLEIVVSTWYRVMVFDGETGRKQAECRWHKGRNYGHFQVADLNGDGLPEAIVLADFMIHLNVLRNDAGQLSVAWRKELDYRLFGKRKAVRTLPDAVVRVAGRLPLVIGNVFNDTGDERWHVMLWDGLTGDTVADLPGRFCHGQADLDTSGSQQLLLATTTGAGLPESGPLAIAAWRDGAFVEQALPHPGRWLRWTPPLPETAATIAAGGRWSTLITDGDGRRLAWAVLSPAAGPRQVAGLGYGPDGVRVAAALALPDQTQVQVSAAGARPKVFRLDLLGAGLPGRELAATGLAVRQEPAAAPPVLPDVPLVADLGGRRAVVVPYGDHEVAAIDPPRDGQPATVRWHRPGRSRGANYESYHEGFQVADLPVGRAVLAATSTADGRAALVGYGAAGEEVFRQVFPPRFPGSDPVWNEGGLTHWLAAPFGGSAVEVYASLRRSVMHTDESVVMTPDGAERWWCADVLERGCGGKAVAVVGRPGGSLLIGQYPDLHYVLDGGTGRPLATALLPSAGLGGWTGYAHPVFLELADGPAVILGGCSYSLARMTLDGQVRWHGEYLDGATAPVAVRREQERWEIGLVAYRGGFRCHDAETGALRWSWPGRPTTAPIACDIDGDGEEEFLVAAGDHLIALAGRDGQPRVRWDLDLKTRCGPPVAADVDGDGASEVVLLTADGRVVVVGQQD